MYRFNDRALYSRLAFPLYHRTSKRRPLSDRNRWVFFYIMHQENAACHSIACCMASRSIVASASSKEGNAKVFLHFGMHRLEPPIWCLCTWRLMPGGASLARVTSANWFAVVIEALFVNCTIAHCHCSENARIQWKQKLSGLKSSNNRWEANSIDKVLWLIYVLHYKQK